MTRSCEPADEWQEVPPEPDLRGTRCRDCRHWWPCEFEDEREARDDLGCDAVDDMLASYGMCEVDSPALVRGDRQAFDRDGYECWEGRR